MSMVTGAASLIEFVTFSKMTNIQGDEIWLLLGSGIGFQTVSMISLERTMYKINYFISDVASILHVV